MFFKNSSFLICVTFNYYYCIFGILFFFLPLWVEVLYFEPTRRHFIIKPLLSLSQMTKHLLLVAPLPSCSATALHAALQDEEARHRSARGQLSAAQVHCQREPSAWHRLAERQPPAGRWEPRQEEEVDVESEEPDATAQREVHLPSVQSCRRNQRHLQGGSHTWVAEDYCHSSLLEGIYVPKTTGNFFFF